MSQKKKLEQLKESILSMKPVILDDKVDDFIDWYTKHCVKGHYTDIGEFNQPKKARDFIEKMAVWYELRYPDYEINKKMQYTGEWNKSVDNIMFDENKYINNNFSENDEVRIINWEDFYNTETFIKSLSPTEKGYLSKPKYPKYITLNINHHLWNIKLTSDGYIITEDNYKKFSLKDKDNNVHNFENIKLNELLDYLQHNNFELDKYDIENNKKYIKRYKNEQIRKEGILNSVMYRIIERSGNRIGPRRALLFAKEFNRNIDIPMRYGIDTSDPFLENFIIEYLKNSNSTNLTCYINYFSRASKYEKLKRITLQELLHTDNLKKYLEEKENTSKKLELQQKLVNTLSSKINEEELQKQKVKELRINKRKNNL